MLDTHTLFYTLLTLSGLVIIRYYFGARAVRRKVRHPPSPRSLPFVGNALSIPSGLEHIAYMTLGGQLESDIVHLEFFGQSIIVINSAKAASDLFEKRSLLYLDRLCLPVFKDPTLLDMSNAVVLLGYNNLWRQQRRALNAWFNSRSVTQFHTLQHWEARALLRRLLNAEGLSEPFEQVKQEIYYSSASSVFQLAYGYRLQGIEDPFLVSIQKTAGHITEAGMFTNFCVNIFPLLSRVPDWVPGTGWKRTIREWRAEKERTINEPFEWTKAQVVAGVADTSIISALLLDNDLNSGLTTEEKENRLKELAFIIVLGGMDTTAAILVKFVAAMVTNPHVQQKAQEEIDSVVGQVRLPTIADQEQLPYVRNLILEVSRWHTVVPTGIPHMCCQDDNYKGYDIQKGTIVIGNVWAMSRDESVYKDPEVFDPDRFLDANVLHLPVFGWGRRKCPGTHFADASLFLVIASLLATFTFSKKKDEKGNEITPAIEGVSNAIILELKPFEFELSPRSERHRELILQNA